jgi:nucleoside-diphosphate-sugar epimerase
VQAAAEAMRDDGGPLRWVGYLSSTGVYGDHDGGWVDESSQLRSADPKACARIQAEAEWLKLHESCGLPVAVFRLGGIYGPGRSVEDAIRRQLVTPGVDEKVQANPIP